MSSRAPLTELAIVAFAVIGFLLPRRFKEAGWQPPGSDGREMRLACCSQPRPAAYEFFAADPISTSSSPLAL